MFQKIQFPVVCFRDREDRNQSNKKTDSTHDRRRNNGPFRYFYASVQQRHAHYRASYHIGTVVAAVARRLVPNCSAAMVTNMAQ